MRYILFRGKCLVSGDFIYGDLIQYEPIPCIRPINQDLGENYDYDEIEVDNKTIGQFTGLLDKNGTNIFEGDLIQGCFEPDPSPNFKGCMINLKKYSVNAKVVFFNNGFCLQNLIKGRAKKAWVHKGLSKVKDLEIIGNIHDHAKL